MVEEKKKKEEKEEQAEGNINIDLGLGGIFKGLGNFVEMVGDMAEKGEEFREKVQEFQGKGSLKDIKGVYGFSVKTGIGGQPTVESFGNVKSTPKGPVVEETREPIVDVFEEENEIQIVAEIPGVDENNIEFEVNGDILNLTANSGDRKYQKEILMPSAIEDKPISKTFNNGILEAKFKKK